MNKKSLLYLGKERTLFIGKLEPLLMSQGAATLCLSLGEPISVRLIESNKELYCTSVLIPPNCTLYIDSRSQLSANINLDVMGEDFYHLAKEMDVFEEAFFNIRDEYKYRRALLDIFDAPLSLKKVQDKLSQLIKEQHTDSYFKEPRVQKAVDLIQGTIEDNLSIDYLAKQTNLSVSGLTKLFKKQTGVPIRRYRQWHRVFTTAAEIGKGKTLTEAALLAGFVDLPHCSHVFSSILGIKPSYFLHKSEQIQIYVEGELDN
ncbi:MAG: AraC-like DNA-binding protein [Oceanicoccus sp.]|jgi:AraC-like DNA-binding protein